jgi:hypothetical protein
VTRFKLFLYKQQTAPKSAVCFAFVFIVACALEYVLAILIQREQQGHMENEKPNITGG